MSWWIPNIDNDLHPFIEVDGPDNANQESTPLPSCMMLPAPLILQLPLPAPLILQLPPEMITEIARHLNAADIIMLACTCKSAYTIISKHASIQIASKLNEKSEYYNDIADLADEYDSDIHVLRNSIFKAYLDKFFIDEDFAHNILVAYFLTNDNDHNDYVKKYSLRPTKVNCWGIVNTMHSFANIKFDFMQLFIVGHRFLPKAQMINVIAQLNKHTILSSQDKKQIAKWIKHHICSSFFDAFEWKD